MRMKISNTQNCPGVQHRVYLQPGRISVAKHTADLGFPRPNPCQPPLYQLQLTQEAFSPSCQGSLPLKAGWGWRGRKPFLRPSYSLQTRQPWHGASRTLFSAAGAHVRAVRHEPASKHLPGHLAPPWQSQRAFFLQKWLGLELLGIRLRKVPNSFQG